PRSNSESPFLQSGGKYAWPAAETLLTAASLEKPYELNYRDCTLVIDVDSLSGTLVFYGLHESTFYVGQHAGVYSFKSVRVSTPRLDGDLSEWWIGKLPSMVGGTISDTVSLSVYHPRLANYHYFRAYKNGELIEKTLGCGYTAEIAPTAAPGTTVVNLPLENLADKLNVVEYDFSISTCRDDPLIFTFGMITYDDGADEANTRVFDSQTVTYYPVTCDVPSPIRLTINVTNNNGPLTSKYLSGMISLDGSQPDTEIPYTFYNEWHWAAAGKVTGHLTNDGILTDDMVYDFALTVFRPDLVKEQTAAMTVVCGETSEDQTFTVILHRNPVTGTFDGQLVLEGGNYTIDQLPAYFDIDFLYDVPEQGDLTAETGDAAARSISDAEKWFRDVQEQLADDAAALASIDTAEFLDMLSAVVPAGEEGEAILATAQEVCDYQNMMSGYYASMTDQLQTLIGSDEFSQAILNDGYIDPALFGDTESAIAVYKELEFEADQLLENGFTAYPGANGAVYYLLQSEKGAA
ncbi:MAG: hypothetical protein J6330_09680, partial [Clostridia bacterium]|nr:hypothetical protein [Clostridia bacterium]